jgi:uncharacterized protein with FMN-binding domain
LNTYEQHSTRKLIVTFMAIAVIAGSILFADHLKSQKAVAAPSVQSTVATNTAQQVATTTSPSAPTTVSQDSSTNATTATPVASSGYKDGTYSAASNYYVPSGNESIKVTLTLKDGVVTDSSIQNSEGDHESARYQQDFASVYKKYVVGKKISSLQLGVIAGASDTTQGFATALSQISAKAQA